jgi:hypothetical protein
MKIFLGIAAILGFLFGFSLLFAPVGFYQPVGLNMTPMMATVAQAHGATLLGLSLVNWLSRSADRAGLIAVFAGNLLVQVASLGVVLRTMSLGAGAAVAPGVVIHVVLGAAFAACLVKTVKSNSNAV